MFSIINIRKIVTQRSAKSLACILIWTVMKAIKTMTIRSREFQFTFCIIISFRIHLIVGDTKREPHKLPNSLRANQQQSAEHSGRACWRRADINICGRQLFIKGRAEEMTRRRLLIQLALVYCIYMYMYINK